MWAYARLGREDPTRPASLDKEMIADFEALGVSVSEEAREQAGQHDFEIWDINADSVRAFTLCQSQWRVALGMSALIWQGLDYAGVEAVLRNWFGRRRRGRRLFKDICVMEIAALNVLNQAGGA